MGRRLGTYVQRRARASARERAEDVVRVLVVDDHPVFRRGMAALLGSLPGMVVAGEADTADGAVAAVEAHRPDVVAMDPHLGEPGVSGSRPPGRSCGCGPARPSWW
ncbi:response regulator [Streptomyces sp. NPDC096105]|uniref:response regulator n=1 Tax=Streptomyces sp. NPDC096105 TaxID=3366074 RepID=UPI0037FE5CC0